MIAVVASVVLAFVAAVKSVRDELREIREQVVEERIWRCVHDPVSCGYSEFPGLDEK